MATGVLAQCLVLTVPALLIFSVLHSIYLILLAGSDSAHPSHSDSTKHQNKRYLWVQHCQWIVKLKHAEGVPLADRCMGDWHIKNPSRV